MNSHYGLVASSYYDEDTLAVEMLKKCLLNLKNAEKFIQNNQPIGVEQRMINTMQLIQELDFMLNREEENETIIQIGNLFDWIIRECETTIEKKDEENDLKKVQSLMPIVENLLTGFRERVKLKKQQKEGQNP